MQYSAASTGPANCCFTTSAFFLKAFVFGGVEDARQLLDELKAQGTSSSVFRNIQRIHQNYKFQIEIENEFPQSVEDSVFLEESLKRLHPVRLTSDSNNIRIEIAEYFKTAKSGLYTVGVQAFDGRFGGVGHEVGVVIEESGEAYLLDYNRGIRHYADVNQFVDHFPKMKKMAYFETYNFNTASISKLCPLRAKL
ncbi:MAG: hypothetical protein ACI9BD_001272 [Candidatus Marinamargulisbacteria bacterium]